MPKGSSGIKRVGGRKEAGASGMLARTIQEANALAVQLGIAKQADFTGIDVSAANEMITEIHATREMFPQLKELEYVGSFGNLEQLSGRSLPDNALGVFSEWSSGQKISIGINEKYASPQKISELRRGLRWEVQELWHPVGCDTVKAQIDHEIGHWIDRDVQAFRDRQIVREYRKHLHGVITTRTLPSGEKVQGSWSMIAGLSRYADNPRIQEFIAEAWSEYRNNPNPRPIAKAVGDRMVELYRKGHKK